MSTKAKVVFLLIGMVIMSVGFSIQNLEPPTLEITTTGELWCPEEIKAEEESVKKERKVINCNDFVLGSTYTKILHDIYEGAEYALIIDINDVEAKRQNKNVLEIWSSDERIRDYPMTTKFSFNTDTGSLEKSK